MVLKLRLAPFFSTSYLLDFILLKTKLKTIQKVYIGYTLKKFLSLVCEFYSFFLSYLLDGKYKLTFIINNSNNNTNKNKKNSKSTTQRRYTKFKRSEPSLFSLIKIHEKKTNFYSHIIAQ